MAVTDSVPPIRGRRTVTVTEAAESSILTTTPVSCSLTRGNTSARPHVGSVSRFYAECPIYLMDFFASRGHDLRRRRFGDFRSDLLDGRSHDQSSPAGSRGAKHASRAR